MKNADMFADLSATLAWKLFTETTYPWEALPQIKAFVRALRKAFDLPQIKKAS